MNCIVCNKVELVGRQRKYCGVLCKNKDTNAHHQSYQNQAEKALRLKFELIANAGGECKHCGYKKNFAALNFHHLRDKEFNLDSKSLGNRRRAVILAEAEKCILLCSNCHMEEHHPQCNQ